MSVSHLFQHIPAVLEGKKVKLCALDESHFGDAQFEGIIRKERVLEKGTVRDAALYSIIDSEWPVVKVRLLQKIKIRESADLMLQIPEFHGSVSYVYP